MNNIKAYEPQDLGIPNIILTGGYKFSVHMGVECVAYYAFLELCDKIFTALCSCDVKLKGEHIKGFCVHFNWSYVTLADILKVSELTIISWIQDEEECPDYMQCQIKQLGRAILEPDTKLIFFIRDLTRPAPPKFKFKFDAVAGWLWMNQQNPPGRPLTFD